VISFISLFILQNVFQQKTYIPVEYQLTAEAEQRILKAGIGTDALTELRGETYPSAKQFRKAVSQRTNLNAGQLNTVMSVTEIEPIVLTFPAVNRINNPSITADQKKAVLGLVGKAFTHRWQLETALAERSPDWRPVQGDKEQNDKIMLDLDYIYRLIRSTQ